MLALVEDILPIGSNELNSLQLFYTRSMPASFALRNTDAIKRGLFLLKNTRKPTGEASVPIHRGERRRAEAR